MNRSLEDRITKYIEACPEAISGQGGHKATFTVACALVNGFGLDPPEALPFLTHYNQRCQPPWTEKELIHKVQSAASASHSKPRGHLLGNGSNWQGPIKPTPRAILKEPEKPAPPIPVHPERIDDFPEPQLNPTIAFLTSAFKPGEGVCIAKAVKHAKEDRDVPDGAGTVYERDTLIEILKKHQGDPNPIFDSDRGAYVRVNSMKGDGGKDEDVGAFRHALVEFDDGGAQEQWEKFIQSGAPITAILTSGGRSVHAWVRVDATDAKDFKEKVEQVYSYFLPLGADIKNKNPSRFSRLPGMKRGTAVQELLAINIGASSFQQWMIDRAAAGIGTPMTWPDLLNFKAADDTNCVIGDRWLCKGGSCLIVGPTGVGKSSLAFQAAVLWAVGRPIFGVNPKHPLKSVFVQAENDIGDMAEIAQGVLLGCGLIREDEPEANKAIIDTLKQNLIVIRDQAHVGLDFCIAAKKLIDKHKPDLFWADPLLSYYGDDVKEQKAASTFLRTWLNPISEATGVIWMFLHHTPKPSREKNKSGAWQDYAYAGLGSVEFSGWARAIVVLVRCEEAEDEFRCIFAKRGYRAGATDPDGTKTTELYLAHSSPHICWKQIPKPQATTEADDISFADKFARSLPDDFFPASATKIVSAASSFLQHGIRTTWKLWDRGQGSLASPFVKSTIPGCYDRIPSSQPRRASAAGHD